MYGALYIKLQLRNYVTIELKYSVGQDCSYKGHFDKVINKTYFTMTMNTRQDMEALNLVCSFQKAYALT